MTVHTHRPPSPRTYRRVIVLACCAVSATFVILSTIPERAAAPRSPYIHSPTPDLMPTDEGAP